MTEKFSIVKVKEMLKDIINSCYDCVLEKQKAKGYIVLKHGLATRAHVAYIVIVVGRTHMQISLLYQKKQRGPTSGGKCIC